MKEKAGRMAIEVVLSDFLSFRMRLHLIKFVI